jgi:hypothetical protein
VTSVVLLSWLRNCLYLTVQLPARTLTGISLSPYNPCIRSITYYA